MAAVKTEERVILKLMVIKEKNKVLFAEPRKDFVDILFSFLTLPLGTIARLARNDSNMQPIEVASLSSLCQSLEDLDNKYPQIRAKKCYCDPQTQWNLIARV